MSRLDDAGSEPQPTSPNQSSISVVIPTYEGVDNLVHALESILSQTKPPGEVIVVDDSETRAVEELVTAWLDAFSREQVPLVYLRNPGLRGLPASRNFALARTRGEIVLFVDDDVVLDTAYLEELWQTYQSNQFAVGVQGYWVSHNKARPSSFFQNSFGRIFFLWHYSRDSCEVLPSASATYPRTLAYVMSCQWLSGCNMSFRKSIFSEFQFDEKLRNYACGEDIDFSYRIFNRYPGCLLTSPRARLTHKAAQANAIGDRSIILMRFVYSRYLFHKLFIPSLGNRLVFSWSTTGRVLEQLVRDIVANLQGRRGFGLSGFKFALDGARLSRRYSKQIKTKDLSFFDAILALPTTEEHP